MVYFSMQTKSSQSDAPPPPSRVSPLLQADDPSVVTIGDNDELTQDGSCFVKV